MYLADLRSRSIRKCLANPITSIPLIEDEYVSTRRLRGCVERTQSDDAAPISSVSINQTRASLSVTPCFCASKREMIGASPSLFLRLVQPWRNSGLDSSVRAVGGEWNNRIISSMIKIEERNCGRRKRVERFIWIESAWTRSVHDYGEYVIDGDIKTLRSSNLLSRR